MSLQRLELQHFRNLIQLKLTPSPRLNILYGANGSGKTSVLEAVYLLGYGRSFRSHLIKPLINYQAEKTALFAEFNTYQGQKMAVGLEKSRYDGQRIRLNGQDIQSLADIVDALPMQLINPDSYQLLDSGPKYRRQFLDWGVFHVEHQFYPLWKRFQRALRQRNAALKQNPSHARHWDAEFIPLAEQIDRFRQEYISRFQQALTLVLNALLPDIPAPSMSYLAGWDREKGLAETLNQRFNQDCALGYTQNGPQRADIAFKVQHLPANAVLSRGQQKALVAAMAIAQGEILQQQSGKRCIYLVDDLAAELDVTHRRAMIQRLLDLQAQLFVTGVERQDVQEWAELADAQMFHVEQGQLDLVV